MTTPPGVFGQFGMTLAFAERALTETLHEHLAQHDTKPETWYALQLIATRGPGYSGQALTDDLARSRNIPPGSAGEVVTRLRAEGLIGGGDHVEPTVEGAALHRSLRDYVLGTTARLLGQFDLRDIETTVRTLQAVTKRAEQEALTSAV